MPQQLQQKPYQHPKLLMKNIIENKATKIVKTL